MARSTGKITCDATGCSKQLGEKNDHISVVANHILPLGETDGVATSALSGDFDFCSWEHAAEHFTAVSGEAADAREAKLSGLRAEAAAAEPSSE